MASSPISIGHPETSYLSRAYFLQAALVFALYFGAGRVGLAVPYTSSNVSPVWPAAGIGVAAVLTFGARIFPAIAAAAFLVNVLSPIPTPAAIGIGIGNSCGAVLAGYLLQCYSKFQTSLPRLKDVWLLVAFGAVSSATIAASVGVTSLTIAHTKAWSGFNTAWRVWWLGDAMGVVIVAPLLLAGKDLLRRCRGWRALEYCLLSITVLGVSAAIFGPWAAVQDDVLAFVVFPLVIWAAIRYRVGGAAAASMLVAAIAVWGTAHGFGPFVNHTPLHNAVLLQLFVAVTSITGLILAAVINERADIGEAFESEQRLVTEIEAVNQRLEERVRVRTGELEQKTTQLAHQARLLDLANDAIFVRDAEGRITYWNEGARRLYGWTAAEVLTKSTQDILQTEFPIDVSEILRMDRWEGELRQRQRGGTHITVASRWTTLRDQNGNAVGWLEINTDVTARKRAEDSARRLSGRILTLQDDERRRIARGLHDSLGQYLVALKMNLDVLPLSDTGKDALAECLAILDKCVAETRTISYLLHPPMLDEAGFGSAARWYVDGFAKRSGIKVNLNLPRWLNRWHRDVEVALFRGVQESLTNIHKHSGAAEVDIRLRLDSNQVRLEIRDDGRGIPQKKLKHLTDGGSEAGVGISGMVERMRELGGSLEIQSNRTGTTVLITVPLEMASPDSEENLESS